MGAHSHLPGLSSDVTSPPPFLSIALTLTFFFFQSTSLFAVSVCALVYSFSAQLEGKCPLLSPAVS